MVFAASDETDVEQWLALSANPPVHTIYTMRMHSEVAAWLMKQQQWQTACRFMQAVNGPHRLFGEQ